MHPCDRRHIVLTDGYAGFIVGRIGHVAGPRQRIHDNARGINEVAMNFRYGNSMLEQDLHDVRFPLQFGKDRDVSGAISAQVKFNDLAILFRSEEHTSELQSLMRISYAVFCWKKKKH